MGTKIATESVYKERKRPEVKEVKPCAIATPKGKGKSERN